jgi:hypothetical protein
MLLYLLAGSVRLQLEPLKIMQRGDRPNEGRIGKYFSCVERLLSSLLVFPLYTNFLCFPYLRVY